MPSMNSTAALVSFPPLDSASQGWLDALRASGSERERAVQRLHELMLRATRFEVGRRAAASTWPGAEREDLAQQSADERLDAVLGHMGSIGANVSGATGDDSTRSPRSRCPHVGRR